MHYFNRIRVKTMPKSLNYHPSLISRLKNPEYAADFLTAIMEESDPEPELLLSALADVVTALGDECMTPEQASLYREKLRQWEVDRINFVYELARLLENFGLKLTVTARPSPQMRQSLLLEAAKLQHLGAGE
jgi:DNA-binding phage protein